MTNSRPAMRQRTTRIKKNKKINASCDEFALPKNKKIKNSKGIAAATEEKFRQPLLKTFSTRCCSSCRVFDSLSSQTFPLVLPALARSHALFAACSFQSRVDFFYIPWRSKASVAGKHAHNPAKTIGFPRPGSEGVEHIKPLQTQKHKDVCLKINMQQPCPGRKICHGHCDRVRWSRISPVSCVDCCSRLRSGASVQ